MARIVNITFDIQTTQAVNNVKNLNEQLKQTAKYAKQVEKPINININAGSGGNNGFTNVNTGLMGINNALTVIPPSANNAGRAMVGFGSLMGATFVGSRAMIGIRNFTDDFLKLENAIYSLKVVAGSSAPAIEKLRMDMLDMAKTSSFSAIEFAKAMDTIMRTGQSFTDAQNLVKASENLALASGESLGDAVNILNKLVVALNINTGDAQKLTESLHATAIGTATDLAGLTYKPFRTNPCKRGVIKLIA